MNHRRSALGLLLFHAFVPIMVLAQKSQGGLPPSFSPEIAALLRDYPVATVLMQPVDEAALRAEDEKESGKHLPPRFGYPLPVDLGLRNAGTWTDLPDGSRLWRLRIVSPGARSLNFIFDRYLLPEGAKLFLYSADRRRVLGAFTSANNKRHGKFSTDLIPGDTVVLEYFEDAKAPRAGEIHLSRVIHGYKSGLFEMGFGESGDCNIDVKCPLGDDWCREIHSVAMILYDENTRAGSGSLVNNTSNDLTPYYLSAFHNADMGDDGVLTQQEKDGVQTWLFRFRYYSPACSPITDPTDFLTYSGAEFKAAWISTDFLLLKLEEEPDGLYFNGWSRSSTPPSTVTGIHHPSGDVMKICEDDDGAVIGSALGNYPPNHFWEAIWSSGTTEIGSSGSPLYDPDHRVIGQLQGGLASCTTPNSSDHYGRLDLSWEGGGTPDTRLKDWLDPGNLSPTTLDGIVQDLNLSNRTLANGTFTFEVMSNLKLEGNLPAPVSPANTEFTVEGTATATFKSEKSIVMKPGVALELGSTCILYIGDVECGGGTYFGGEPLKIVAQEHKSQPAPGDAAGRSVAFATNYPNPFSGVTTIEYTLEQQGAVEIRIVNLTGETIRTLVDEPTHAAGTYRIGFDGRELPAGGYYCIMRAASGIFSKKMLLIR